MTMKELMEKTPERMDELNEAFILRGNMTAVKAISIVKKFAHKRVRVVKGRKVPKGTEGEVFWLGSYCNSPYGDSMGLYTTFRCGIRDDDGNVHWTSVDNIEAV
jgi:hypothetical protein